MATDTHTDTDTKCNHIAEIAMPWSAAEPACPRTDHGTSTAKAGTAASATPR